MSQVVELASEAEGLAEHGGLPLAAGGASRHVTASGVTQKMELDRLDVSAHATSKLPKQYQATALQRLTLCEPARTLLGDLRWPAIPCKEQTA